MCKGSEETFYLGAGNCVKVERAERDNSISATNRASDSPALLGHKEGATAPGWLCRRRGEMAAVSVLRHGLIAAVINGGAAGAVGAAGVSSVESSKYIKKCYFRCLRTVITVFLKCW